MATKELATVVPGKGIIASMAEQYGMLPEAFERTIRATCMRPDKNGREATKEEFAALCLIAHNLGLNPILKEIHAFASKGGGIVPVVSIDGWINLVHRHPQYDGEEWIEHTDESGQLIAMTCTIFHKDRNRPTTIKEHLEECIRQTEPWKMKHRMMRHRSFMQAARYAFGFGGVYDEDEAQDILRNDDAPAPRRIAPKPASNDGGKIIDATPNAASSQDRASEESERSSAVTSRQDASVEAAGSVHTPKAAEPAADHDPETGEVIEDQKEFDPEQFTVDFLAEMGEAEAGNILLEIWDKWLADVDVTLFTPEQQGRWNAGFAARQDHFAAELRAKNLAEEEAEKAAAQAAKAERTAKAERDAKAAEAKAAELDGDKPASAPAESEDAAHLRLIKGLGDTLGKFTDIEALDDYFQREVEVRREEGEISGEDKDHLAEIYAATEKRIKAGIAGPKDGAAAPTRRRAPPAAPGQAGPAATAAPATKPVDATSNAGTEQVDRAFKRGRMAAGGEKTREVPAEFAADPELTKAWLRGYDANARP